jgi:diguanylate cyclase (GGDEF)-like protein/PAS domain S-box-containing protein
MKLPTKYSATRSAIVLACALVIGTVWAVTYQRIGFEREEEIEQAVQANRNLALALEAQTTRVIKEVDLVLRILAHEYLEHGDQMREKIFKTMAAQDLSPHVYLAVIGQSGEQVHGTLQGGGVNFADREHFKFHRDNPQAGLRIGAPTPGRLSGRASIPLSLGIRLPDGSFAGVVVAGVDPAYFTRFYDGVELGADALIQLVTLDGIALARNTGKGAHSGLKLTGSTMLKLAAGEDKGDFVTSGRYDGIERYMSFRVLREHGLLVSVGTSKAYVLSDAEDREFWYLLGSSLATVFVLLFGSGIIAALRRQQHAMETARAGESLYRATYDQAAVGIAHTALDGRFIRANATYCAMVGYTQGELLRKTFMDVLHPDDVPSRETMRRVLSEGGIKEEERFVCKDGTVRTGLVAVAVVRDSAGKPDYFVAMVQDVTERNVAQAKLLHQVHYDTLTGLPNRLLLLDRLTQTLNQARRKEQTVGALYINLDRFKAVNDTLGRDKGDLLLRVAAHRLAASVRAGDSVARIGGDEFAIVLPEIHGAEDAARVARKVIEAMTAPYRIGEQEIFVTASVGIALFPGDGPDAETLLRNADAAMTRAKEVGRNNFQFYTATMNEHSAEKLLLEADLRRALERNEFLLHYQPKVNLATGRVTGMEALLRWQRPDGKLVSPGEFIPLLEESGMIGEVGNWVIHAACAQMRAWQDAGFVTVPVAVNVATKQFLQGDLHAVVGRALSASGIEPRLLEIEITESDAMQDHDRVIPVLQALKERGVSIAIDDFGTGYSSLGYLSKLPVHTLKIDRSFIIRMHSEPNAMTLVSTMISLAHSLRLKVVAEGVEKEEQSALLRLLRCDEMQGYLFSRPLPAADCVRHLDATAAATQPVEMVAA